MSYRCIYHDGGRAESKRPKQNYDCTVRALAIITGESYDTVYDKLAKLGRKCSKRFSIERVMKKGWSGWTIERIVFPERGEKRMNPVTFAKQFSEGRYIVKVARHVFVFIDGDAYDEVKTPNDRCIYAAWRFINGKGNV